MMRVYLAHPIILYASDEKQKILEIIKKEIGTDIKVIDPSKYDLPHNTMKFYHMLIDFSDIIIYMPIMG
jgi:hypothetical protein